MLNAELESWRNKFSGISAERIFDKNEILFSQGDKISYVYLVISGKAEISSYSENGLETFVGEYDQGQFIGTLGIFNNFESEFEIKAMTRLVVRSISLQKITELVRTDPETAEFLLRDVSSRLLESMLRSIDFHTLSVKGRVCVELLRLSSPIGIDPSSSIIRPCPIFVDLARKLNSTRETVSRTISELQSRGALSREPGVIIIPNPKQLKRLAETF